MYTYRLEQLEPRLLENVITKLKSRSYYRLQRTCRFVIEFIRSSRKISVSLGGRVYLRFKKDISTFKIDYFGWVGEIDVDRFHGTRLEKLILNVEEETYKHIAECLKINRIACVRLKLLRGSSWTTEQLAALLKILKPVELSADEEIDGVDPLCRAKSLTLLDITLSAFYVDNEIQRLLSYSKFKNVTLHLEMSSLPLPLFITVVQKITTTPKPALDYLHLIVSSEKHVLWDFPSRNELVEQFGTLGWSIDQTGNNIFARVEIGALCEIVIASASADFVYYRS